MNGEECIKAARWTLEQLREGQSYSFDHVFSEEEVDKFTLISGDQSPIHIDETFARQRGYEGRVIHGVLLAGLVSRLVGMHLPGQNAVLQSLTLNFVMPAYIGDAVELRARIDQISLATRTIVLKFEIAHKQQDRLLARGKAQIGLTTESSDKNRTSSL